MPSQGSVRGLAAASLIALATLVVDHFHRLPVVAVALAGACALAVTLRLLRGLAETARSAHATGLARDQAVEASIAKSAFVATVSHELRTPLSGVIGMTELLLETPLSMEQREYTEIVRSSGEGMLLVINDILDYSKIEAGKLDLDESTFALRETVAAGCAALLVIAQNKGIELDVLNDSDLPQWVRGDAGRLRQVVINLVANAVKFTDVGHVTVRLVATRPEGARGDRVRVRVEVSDTGIGIDAPTLARLFQPFTQGERSTARTYGGTGLGLTISARLVQMMGGTIGATSNPGEGSTFWFELPLRSAEAPEAPPAREIVASMAVPPRQGLGDDAPLVLVAEDNPVNQMLAARLLERSGYRAEIVASGREAVWAVEQATYAAVLMDCQMPELDGYAATREIRARERGERHLPIIAMTANSMAGDREKCLAAGMDDYISKPIRARELQEVLDRLVVTEADYRADVAAG